MTQASISSVVNLFKKNYSKMNANDVLTDGLKITEDIPFSEKARVGESYVEAVILGSEVGITYAGSGSNLFSINPASAGAVQQAVITPYISMLRSIIPYQTISRSSGSDSAFVEATKHVMKNNIASHKRFLEIAKIYGQATNNLGYVSYATATYRTVSFTNGAGTLISSLFGSVAFTAGVNTTDKYILLAPGNFASGIWVGMQGVKVKQIATSSGLVVAEGTLVAVDSALGILKVDFTPVAASSTTSHKLAFDGMESANEMVGIKKILNNTGSLFSISAATYPLWKANTVALSSVKLTLANLASAVADTVNAGGLMGKVKAYCNPRSFNKVVSDQAALRQYVTDQNKEFKNGAMSIEFAFPDVTLELVGSRYIMEGDCLILRIEDWECGGSSDVQISIPGMPDERLIFSLESQGGYAFNTYADEFIFCRLPAKQTYISGINDESAS